MIPADLFTFITSADATELTADQRAALATIRSMIQTSPPVVAPNTPWRMYPDLLAEGVTLPALTYQMISDVSELTEDGDCGLYIDRIQIDAWANSAVDRATLGDAVRTLLHGYSGMIGGGSPITGTPTCVVQWDNSIDEYEPDRLQYRRVMDFKIAHN